jgi:hypothetical protein
MNGAIPTVWLISSHYWENFKEGYPNQQKAIWYFPDGFFYDSCKSMMAYKKTQRIKAGI